MEGLGDPIGCGGPYLVYCYASHRVRWLVDRRLAQRTEIILLGVSPRRGSIPTRAATDSYKDFAAWQRQEDQTLVHKRQLAYWTELVKGKSATTSSLRDRPRPGVLSGGRWRRAKESSSRNSLYEALLSFCKAHQVTPSRTLLAAFPCDPLSHDRCGGRHSRIANC